MELLRGNRFPVSTKRTGCKPFNIRQKGQAGYKVGENPVKEVEVYVGTYADALQILRSTRIAGWRDYGQGGSSSARMAIGWVTKKDADRLLAESDDSRRVKLFESLTDVID